MIKIKFKTAKVFTLTTLAATMALSPITVLAQTQPPTNTAHQSLSALTESAWLRQSEYLTRDSQLNLLRAKEQLNKRITPEPGAIELGSNRGSQGGRGYELAYSTPLWLKNERQLSSQNLQSEAQGLDAKLAVSKWRIAGQVRELYWAWIIARSDVRYVVLHAESTTQLLNDVKKRLAAGDMTAADLKQAEIAQINSLAIVNEAKNNEKTARLMLSSLTAEVLDEQILVDSSVETVDVQANLATEKHPLIASFQSQISQISLANQLAILQTRARPELSVGVGRDKGANGDRYQSSVRVGFKLPLTSVANTKLAQVTAQTRLDELRTEQAFETKKLTAELSIAEQRLRAIEQQVELAQNRINASKTLLGMIQKAFSLGEFDLPSRIRAAAESSEAQRQLSKIMLEKAAATSAYKQALGLLP